MENTPSLEERAQHFSHDMQERLELPDNIQLKQDYRAAIGGEFSLDLAAASSTFNDGPNSNGVNRYIYLNGPHGEVCRPLFSLNLAHLVETAEVDGLTWDLDSIEAALAVADPAYQQEIRLIEAIRAINGQTTVSAKQVGVFNELFMDLVEQGSSVAIKSVSAKHDDGTTVYAREISIEGSLANVSPFFVSEPLLEVRARRPKAKLQTVFDEGRAGQYETYEQIADSRERAAAYTDPKNVYRDESGKVNFVMSDPRDALAIASAERAAGMRDLDVERLDFVEHYARALLLKQE